MKVTVAPPTQNYIEYRDLNGELNAVPGLKRLGNITLEFNWNSDTVDYIRNSWFNGRPVRISHNDIDYRGYVTGIKLTDSIDGLRTVTATIQPTGAPQSNAVTARHLQQAADRVLQQAKNRVPLDTGALRRSFHPSSSIGFLVASGWLSFDPHPHCRSIVSVDWAAGADALANQLAIRRENTKVKIINKFYVASPNVTTPAEQKQLNTPENVALAVTSHHAGRWTRPTLNAALEHAKSMLENDPNLEHVAIVKIVKLVRRKAQPLIVEDVK